MHPSRMCTARLLTVCLLVHTSGEGGASICTPPRIHPLHIHTPAYCIVGWMHPLLVNRLSHAFENITFPILHMRAVMNETYASNLIKI